MTYNSKAKVTVVLTQDEARRILSLIDAVGRDETTTAVYNKVADAYHRAYTRPIPEPTNQGPTDRMIRKALKQVKAELESPEMRKAIE